MGILSRAFREGIRRSGGRSLSELRSADDAGSIAYRKSPFEDAWMIDSAEVAPELRGQGLGRELYQELIDRARNSGISRVDSDAIVSPEARRVWEALRRRGYQVSEGDPYMGQPAYSVLTEPVF